MYKLLRLRILFLFCLLFVVSCGAPAPKSGSPVSDQELNAAIEQARSTIDMLLHAMLAPKPSYDFLGIKVRFSRPDGTFDDNWVEPIDYYDGIFTIKMMDGLNYNTNLHIDHTLNIPQKRVVDWMIVEKDGNLIGGYTIRLAYEHMTTEDKAEFLRVTGYKIE